MDDAQYPAVAELVSVSRRANGHPNSTMLFNMRTKRDLHPIDVKTILKCLKHAEEKETIPALPVDWWVDIWLRFGDLK